MKYLYIFSLVFLLSACQEPVVEQDVSAATDELNTLKIELKKFNDPTLMHTVYVWLKEDLSDQQLDSFIESATGLAQIRSVSRLRMGKPAGTEARDVVDQSYDFAMNIEFNSIEDHNNYQTDPIHLKFVEDNKDKWTKVQVFDNMME